MDSDLGNRNVMAENIKYYMRHHQKTRSDMCLILDVAYTTFCDWVNAKTYPRIDKIERMADFFGIQKSDLIESKDGRPASYSRPLPILGMVAAGLPMLAEENIEGYIAVDGLPSGGKYFALRVHGDSMNAAHIIEGALVIIRQQERVENGEIAVVLVDGEEATLKYFRQDGNSVTLFPKSFNPEHRPQFYSSKDNRVQVVGKLMRVETDAELLV